MQDEVTEFEWKETYNIKKEAKLIDKTPSIVLCNPKYPHNVGAAVRAASCFGAKSIIFTGSRVSLNPSKGYRLPREERMKGYKDVMLLNDDYPFNRFNNNVVPVAVEVRENSEPLPIFIHPENAIYVFGPEDGSISQMMLTHCHRFIVIPSKHCLNLAAAVYLILYDRITKIGALNKADIQTIEAL